MLWMNYEIRLNNLNQNYNDNRRKDSGYGERYYGNKIGFFDSWGEAIEEKYLLINGKKYTEISESKVVMILTRE
jgi:hypothetical protein